MDPARFAGGTSEECAEKQRYEKEFVSGSIDMRVAGRRRRVRVQVGAVEGVRRVGARR